MKLTVRELRILSSLVYYDDLFELTMNEIDSYEKNEYMSNNENLRITISEWFYNYLSERIFKKEIGEKTIYFFLRSCEDLYFGEFERVINKINFSSQEEFYENLNKIYEENNYCTVKDYFNYFDDDYEE